jgi:hypothetical protein
MAYRLKIIILIGNFSKSLDPNFSRKSRMNREQPGAMIATNP